MNTTTENRLLQIDITFKKLDITSQDNSESITLDVLCLFKPKILQAIDCICKNRKRLDKNAIYAHLYKTEASNISKDTIGINQNILEYKKSYNGTFRLVLTLKTIITSPIQVLALTLNHLLVEMNQISLKEIHLLESQNQ